MPISGTLRNIVGGSELWSCNILEVKINISKKGGKSIRVLSFMYQSSDFVGSFNQLNVEWVLFKNVDEGEDIEDHKYLNKYRDTSVVKESQATAVKY